jgi:MFS family permease
MKDHKKKSIIAIALITAICLIGDSMLYVALPIHWKEVGLSSLIEVGVLLSVNRFVRLPLNPLIGFLYRKMSTRNGILIAVLLSGITTTMYGVFKGFWVWVIMRSLWGLAWSLFKLGAYFSVMELSADQNRGHNMGIYNGLYRIGSLVGMLFGGFLTDIYGIRKVSIYFGFAAFLAIPFVFKYVTNSKQKAKQSETKKSTKPWLNSEILWIMATGFLAIMSLDGMFNAMLSHVIERHFSSNVFILGMTIGAASLAGILQSIRWFLGPWISPWIGNISDGKLGRKPLLAIMLGCVSILVALVPSKLGLGVWIAVLIMILLLGTMLTTVIDSLMSDVAVGGSKVFIITSYAVTVDVGAACGSSIGYVVDRYLGTSAMFFGAAGILLLLTIKWVLSLSIQTKCSLYKTETHIGTNSRSP